MESDRVLVTKCDHPVGLNVTKSLVKKGIEVVYGGKSWYVLSRFSKYSKKYVQYFDPEKDETRFLNSSNNDKL